MIGVFAPFEARAAVAEFFELFKTPWEFADRARSYDVILCTGDLAPPLPARLKLIFRAADDSGQQGSEIGAAKANEAVFVNFSGGRLPIYQGLSTFEEHSYQGVVATSGAKACIVEVESAGEKVVRVGFDLFAEVRFLLTRGQPISQASEPTLDLHIVLLRSLIVGAGLPLVEIPPVPLGYRFAVCLTHDVDHPVLRNHKGDSTMFGFLLRATVGSIRGVLRGRLTLANLARNWAAAGRLPLVHLGWIRDLWRESLCKYAVVEKGLGSTFYFIPFRDRPGKTHNGPAPGLRAAKYGVDDVEKEVQQLTALGCEVGLHGIDAWRDAAAGLEEQTRIIKATGSREIGVRMHWLYFDERTHRVLEENGFSYDSTVGYNETVGFRAGTLQAFKPLDVDHLLELPLHIMDTALFYPGRSNLGVAQAHERVNGVVEHASRMGGVITINWHDRSLAPERLWGGFYEDLLNLLKARNAWFPTAGQMVAWFRQRRAVKLERIAVEPEQIRVNVRMGAGSAGPGMCLRLHRPVPQGPSAKSPVSTYVDLPLRDGEMVFAV